MSNGIKIEGFEEIENMFKDAFVDETDVKKAMRKAIEPIAEKVENNTPARKGKLKKSIKRQVKTNGLGVVGIVKLNKFYDFLQEFGSSQQKHNIGFFDRAIKDSADKGLNILGSELLSKIK